MHGKICMVIGNGEMGKVAAQTLRDAGAQCNRNRPSVQKRYGQHSDRMQQDPLWRENEISATL